MDTVSQNKGFLASVIITIILLVGGIFLFSSKEGKPQEAKKVSDEILMPKTAIRTASNPTNINLVEFGDYQCPACGTYHEFVKKLLAEKESEVNFVFRHFPLTQHKNAQMASLSALSASKQGKYWEMHNKLFESQSEWSTLTDPKDKFIDYARQIGIDTERFKKDLELTELSDIIKKDMGDGNLVGINATPTYFLNGLKLELPSTYEEFKNLVLSAK